MVLPNDQPRWGEIADKFDIWLPQLAPVGEVMLQALAVTPGEHVLDVASGTGEPGLTLARDMPGEINVTGVDVSEAMVGVARHKVLDEKLRGIVFDIMAAESLTFPSYHFDCVMCRFAVMLFDDPLQALKEMHRVLKPGGRFCYTVWSTPETMLSLYWAFEVFKNKIDQQFLPPLHRFTSLGRLDVLGALLQDAGYGNYQIETHNFFYEYDTFDAFWDAVESSDILKTQYEALPESERGIIRDQMGYFCREFIFDGRLVIPHEYHMVTGKKSLLKILR